MKKKNRVLKTQEFHTMIHTGTKVMNSSFVLYLMPKKEEEARFGISLARKYGNAVVRNKVKRQVRMMCQDLIDFTDFPVDGILIVRKSYQSLSFEDNKKNLEKLLSKATMKEIFKKEPI